MHKSVSFRIEVDKLALLDHLAAVADRDRSYLLNEAVDRFLEVRRWQAEEIRKAIAEADAGEFATDDEVRAAYDAFHA